MIDPPAFQPSVSRGVRPVGDDIPAGEFLNVVEGTKYYRKEPDPSLIWIDPCATHRFAVGLAHARRGLDQDRDPAGAVELFHNALRQERTGRRPDGRCITVKRRLFSLPAATITAPGVRHVLAGISGLGRMLGLFLGDEPARLSVAIDDVRFLAHG
jgi:hypothetical protein